MLKLLLCRARSARALPSQDKIMPLRHVPVLSPRSDEALKRQGLLLEEIMPQFGPAYAIDAAKCALKRHNFFWLSARA